MLDYYNYIYKWFKVFFIRSAIMSIKRKALRSENRATRNKGGRINISLKERLLRGLLAIGFTMAPWAMPSAYADIVR